MKKRPINDPANLKPSYLSILLEDDDEDNPNDADVDDEDSLAESDSSDDDRSVLSFNHDIRNSRNSSINNDTTTNNRHQDRYASMSTSSTTPSTSTSTINTPSNNNTTATNSSSGNRKFRASVVLTQSPKVGGSNASSSIFGFESMLFSSFETGGSSSGYDPNDVFQAERNTIDEFLQYRNESLEREKEQRANNSHVDHFMGMDSEVYEQYIVTISSSPQAVLSILLYCLEADDYCLVDLLLRDVGIEYIMRHCFIIESYPWGKGKEEKERKQKLSSDSFNYDDLFHVDGSGNAPVSSQGKSFKFKDMNQNDKEESTTTPPIAKSYPLNILWIAALHGSAFVLDLLAMEVKNYLFMQLKEVQSSTDSTDPYDSDGSLNDEELTEKAEGIFSSILDKSVSEWNVAPLYIAAVQNHPEIIKILINHGANPNTTNRFGNTPAIAAISLSNHDALFALGESKNVDFNLGNLKGASPALLACQFGNVTALKFLHEYKGRGFAPVVDFKIQDNNGFGCAALAARYDRCEVMEYLISIHNPLRTLGCDLNQLNYNGESALHVAARFDRPAIVRTLLQETPRLIDILSRYNNGMTALHVAASSNSKSVVAEFTCLLSRDELSQLDTDDSSGMTPLYQAVCGGFTDVVKILAPFSNINKLCREPIPRRRLTSTDSTDSSRNVTGIHNGYILQPPLLAAAKRGDVDIMSILLAMGADIDQTDGDGHTCLSVAARFDNYNMAKMLITQGADVSIKSNSNKTALQKARKYKRRDIIELLTNATVMQDVKR